MSNGGHVGMLKLNWNKRKIKQFHFSQSKTQKRPWCHVLAILANRSRYPLFVAWCANSWYKPWLANSLNVSFHGCFSVLFWLKQNCLISIWFQLHTSKLNTFRWPLTAKTRAILQTVCRLKISASIVAGWMILRRDDGCYGGGMMSEPRGAIWSNRSRRIRTIRHKLSRRSWSALLYRISMPCYLSLSTRRRRH